MKQYIKPLCIGIVGFCLAYGVFSLVTIAYRDHQNLNVLVNIELEHQKSQQVITAPK